MVETGLIKHWAQDAIQKSLSIDLPGASGGSHVSTFQSSSNSLKELSLNNLQGAFVVMGLGLAAALIAFFFEQFRCYTKIRFSKK